MIGELKCKIGLHNGNILTRGEIAQWHNTEIECRSAFVCSRCEKVIE